VKASAMAPVPAIASRLPFADHHVLVAFPEAQAVVGGGGQQQDQRDRRAQERGVVDGALDGVQVGERGGKADGEEEAEQDLGAGDEGAKFLEQLAVFALQPFLDVFVFGSFPEPLLDHVVGGHDCPPTHVWSGTLRQAWICPVSVGAWSVASAPEGPSRIVRMINGCSTRPGTKARGLGNKHRAFRLVRTVVWRRGAEQLTV
jgi:hypothetical protein